MPFVETPTGAPGWAGAPGLAGAALGRTPFSDADPNLVWTIMLLLLDRFDGIDRGAQSLVKVVGQRDCPHRHAELVLYVRYRA